MNWTNINQINPDRDEAAWLNYSGSTTSALETESKNQLKINVLSQKWDALLPDEAKSLNLSESEPAFIREIFMTTPRGEVMYCRSVFPKSALEGREDILLNLGNKPLGKVLFGEAHWQRSDFKYTKLTQENPLFQNASQNMIKKPDHLMARRSQFKHEEKRILITEVFLPKLYQCRLNTVSDYLKLMRLNKPIGIFLAAWPSFWALWLAAKGAPSLKVIIIFVLGAILARSAGCIINDYADRHVDEQVKRTQTRPLATKKINNNIALSLFAILGLAALGLTLLLNPICFKIAIATALLTTIYPLLKRITHLPQLGLGIVFNSGILMAYGAVQNQLAPAAWLLYIGCVFWTIAYDTMYAMTDRQDDVKVGIKSSAILFKQYDIAAISMLLIITFTILIMVGAQLSLGHFYHLGLLVAAGFSLYQVKLIWHRKPKHCFQAFLISNWVGLSIFIGIVINFLF